MVMIMGEVLGIPYEACHIFDIKTLTVFLSIKTVGLAASISLHEIGPLII